MDWTDLIVGLVGVLFGSGGVFATLIVNRRSKRKKDMEEVIQKEVAPLKKGNQCTLRKDLMDIRNKGVAQGFLSDTDRKMFEEEYIAYHELGGNGFIDNVVKPEVENLPSKLEVKSRNNKTKK